MCSLKQKSSGNMCFPLHFHGSGNEHVSLLLGLPWVSTDMPLFLLPPSLNRNVSSSAACCKNSEHLNLLQPAAVARSPPKAAHGPMTSLINRVSLYFPIWESPVTGQAVFPQPARSPCCKDSLCAFIFFSWTFNSLCRLWQTFCQKCLENHRLQSIRVKELQFCSWVHKWLTAGLCPGAWTWLCW